jgi:hypothetical protein
METMAYIYLLMITTSFQITQLEIILTMVYVYQILQMIQSIAMKYMAIQDME